MSIQINQSTYYINESVGLVQPVLVLNASLATDLTVQVRTTDNTATGKLTKSVKNKII